MALAGGGGPGNRLQPTEGRSDLTNVTVIGQTSLCVFLAASLALRLQTRPNVLAISLLL